MLGEGGGGGRWQKISLSLCEYQRESVLEKSWGDNLLDWGWGWGWGWGGGRGLGLDDALGFVCQSADIIDINPW